MINTGSRQRQGQILLLAGLVSFVAIHCTTTVTADLASASTAKTTSGTISVSSATLDASTGCITNVNTVIDTEIPSWIKDNFKCQIIYKDGDYYVFKSANFPNHTSYYWCAAHANGATTCSSGQNPTLWASLPGGNTAAGTNVIASQSLVYKIPVTPSLKSGTLSGTQAGLVSIGITANGLAVYNNAAAPGDTLATESTTFDSFGGHPDSSSRYHHHAAVTKLSASMANGTLLAIMLDGYALYDEKCDQNDGAGAKTLTANGTAASGSSTTDSAGSDSTTLDRLHGHTTTTKHFSTATYHYHYMQDTTATIKTLMGSYFRGTTGSVSN